MERNLPSDVFFLLPATDFELQQKKSWVYGGVNFVCGEIVRGKVKSVREDGLGGGLFEVGILLVK